MPIEENEVDKVAELAKLSFDDHDKQKVAIQLDRIVAYIEKLNELDTENVAQTSYISDLKNILRADKKKAWLEQPEALRNAPRQKKDYFSVPKVIDGSKA